MGKGTKSIILVLDNNKVRLDATVAAINRFGQPNWEAKGREHITEACAHLGRNDEYLANGALDICDEDKEAVMVILHMGNPLRGSYVEALHNKIFLLVTGDQGGATGTEYRDNCYGFPAAWRPESFSGTSWNAFFRVLGKAFTLGKYIADLKQAVQEACEFLGADSTLSKVIHELYIRTLAFKVKYLTKGKRSVLNETNFEEIFSLRTSQSFPEAGIEFQDFIASFLTGQLIDSRRTLKDISTICSGGDPCWPNSSGASKNATEQLEELADILKKEDARACEELNDWIDRFDKYLRELRIELQK